MPTPDGAEGRLRRPWVAVALVDVFAYTVVLNLFVQLLPRVLSESFTVSLLTAVLLKLVLELVLLVKKRVLVRFRAASGPMARIVAGLGVWAVLFGSKVLVLESVDLVLGDAVSLGGLLPVTALVLCLMLSRAGVRRLVG